MIEILEGDLLNEGTTHYCPRVRFSTSSGRTVEFNARTWSTRSRYRLGDDVEVFYHGQDPTDADIRGDECVFYVVLIVVGVPFMATFLVLVLWSYLGR